MLLLLVSFLAGILTVAAPCVLPLLPVIIGGTAVKGVENKRNWRKPLIIAASLAGSVVVFTLLLKATTALLGVPPIVWQLISGGIVILLGVDFVFPKLWETLSLNLNLSGRSNQILSKGAGKDSVAGDVVLGAALGPVFASCSPTYALIVASVLPASFFAGLAYLVAYSAGMAGTLLLIAWLGQRVVVKLKWLANPNGAFRKVVGLLFILVGIGVILGWDKDFQAFVLDQGWYDPIADIEHSLMPENR